VLSRLLRHNPAWFVNGTSAIVCPDTVSSGKICFRNTGRTSKRRYTGVFCFLGDRRCELCCVQSNPLQIPAPLFSPLRMNITRIACETRLCESSYTFLLPVAVRMQNKWALKEIQAGRFINLKPELKFDDFQNQVRSRAAGNVEIFGSPVY